MDAGAIVLLIGAIGTFLASNYGLIIFILSRQQRRADKRKTEAEARKAEVESDSTVIDQYQELADDLRETFNEKIAALEKRLADSEKLIAELERRNSEIDASKRECIEELREARVETRTARIESEETRKEVIAARSIAEIQANAHHKDMLASEDRIRKLGRRMEGEFIQITRERNFIAAQLESVQRQVDKVDYATQPLLKRAVQERLAPESAAPPTDETKTPEA